MFATMFSWLNMTPFGSPVVPELYTKNARSSFGLITTFFPPSMPPSSVIKDEKCLTLPFGPDSPIRIIRFRGNPIIKAASLATSRQLKCVVKPLAPEDFSNDANSPTVYRLFIGQTTPPAQRVPKVIVAISALFGVNNAITSPFCQFHCVSSPGPREAEVVRRECKVCCFWAARSEKITVGDVSTFTETLKVYRESPTMVFRIFLICLFE
jgi:hypothetical protein